MVATILASPLTSLCGESIVDDELNYHFKSACEKWREWHVASERAVVAGKAPEVIIHSILTPIYIDIIISVKNNLPSV